MLKHVRIPDVILNSFDFEGLSQDETKGFQSRLNYLQEVADKAARSYDVSESDLFDHMDNMELDIQSILSLNLERGLSSSYTIRSSWSVTLDRNILHKHLDLKIGNFYEKHTLKISGSICQIRSWLIDWASVMENTLESFTSSTTQEKAITQLILIDALAASFLAFSILARVAKI